MTDLKALNDLRHVPMAPTPHRFFDYPASRSIQSCRKDLPFPGDMTLIRDTNDGEHYWLGGNESLGGCGQTPPLLFRFEADKGQAATLRALQKTHPAMQALLSQCKGEQLLACLGDHAPVEDPVNRRIYPEWGRGMGQFADMHWNAERQAFVSAVLDFKPKALRAMKAKGVFPHWVRDALSAVSASQLSLAEKRRRAAWLFRDRSLLAAALESQMLDGLVDWLPREDWGPIIELGSRIPEQSAVHGRSKRESRISLPLFYRIEATVRTYGRLTTGPVYKLSRKISQTSNGLVERPGRHFPGPA
jgi:hypothetical protein